LTQPPCGIAFERYSQTIRTRYQRILFAHERITCRS
jgi:hypothetical protein